MENNEANFLPEEQQAKQTEAFLAKRAELYKKEGYVTFLDFIEKKGNELRQKYSNANKYRTFHLLIGSTPAPGECTEFDFPGDDSLEKFLEAQEAATSGPEEKE
jgi:hypothetical protein